MVVDGSGPRLRVGCPMSAHPAMGRKFLSAERRGHELADYTTWCNAVEGNTTFYATPRANTVARWAEQGARRLSLRVQDPRTVTHDRRLHGGRAPRGGRFPPLDRTAWRPHRTVATAVTPVVRPRSTRDPDRVRTRAPAFVHLGRRVAPLGLLRRQLGLIDAPMPHLPISTSAASCSTPDRCTPDQPTRRPPQTNDARSPNFRWSPM